MCRADVKRFLFTIMLSLFLGAVVNVAVAWGCAAWPRSGRLQWYLHEDHVSTRERSWLARSGCVPRDDYHWERSSLKLTGLTETLVLEEWDMPWRRGPGRICARMMSAGWPMRAFSGGDLSPRYDPSTGDWGERRLRGAVRLGYTSSPGQPHLAGLLPLRPICPEFLVNTLFYAGLLWLLIPGPFLMRRHIRRRRGRCVKCGYDLRGALPGAGCPECGWRRDVATARVDASVQSRDE